MKNKLLSSVTLLIFFLIPFINFAQAPDLGTASTYALFCGAGAFDNIGASYIIGDIGTNAGAFTGFPPGTDVGQTHVADGASAQAATDVDAAYSYLSGLTCGLIIGTGLGNGQVLTPNIYCLGAASTLNGDLVLDGQGDPNALFIFKIDGALSTGTFSNVILKNSATLCNVYWQINGQFTLGDSSLFRGTILGNGAITLLEASTLEGRGLTRAGKIALHNNKVTVAGDCAVACALQLTLSPTNTTCSNNSDGKITSAISGGSGDYTYAWSNGATTASIDDAAKGSYSLHVTDNVTGCTADAQATIYAPAKLKVTGIATPVTCCKNNTCDGTVKLTATGGTAPYTFTWSDGYIGAERRNLCVGTYSVTVTDAHGCQLVIKGKIVCKNSNLSQSSTSKSDIIISGMHAVVSPNPSKGQVTITVGASKVGVASITLTDLNGKATFTDKINLTAGTNVKSYNWSSLARGVYFVHIQSADKNEVVKIILN